jgi:hypothetical protein
MATVTELLTQLENGEITADDAAREFAFVEWPDEPDRPETLDEAEADPDPEPFTPGGFEEVSKAYADGRIDDATYEALAKAYAEARD